MDTRDKKKVLKILFVSIVSFLLAYSFDQYYIYRRQLYFLSKPVEMINNLKFSILNFQ